LAKFGYIEGPNLVIDERNANGRRQRSSGASLTMLIRCLAVAVALVLWPATDAHAQPAKTARVGVLASSTESNFEPNVKAFRGALGAAGWVEGRNLALYVRYAGEQYARLSELATELVQLKVDVLVTFGTPATQAAQRATATIPIVMESLADVVGTGLVPNLSRPGGNLTGVSGFAPELSGKRTRADS
jgi:putative ABC transport system substrate-binding protein